MITINKTPPSDSFAGNPNVFKVTSDDFYTESGFKSWLILYVDGIDTVVDHGFNLRFNEIDHIFTSSGSPDNSGYQFPTANPAWNHNDYASAIYDCLVANYDIRKHFDVELWDEGGTNRNIYIVAKEKGSQWTIRLEDITLSGLSESTHTDGVNRAYRDNFSIVGTIWNKDSKLIGEDIKGIDDSGKTYFDFSEYLKSHLDSIAALDTVSPPFQFPEDGMYSYVKHPDFVIGYNVGFAEKYEGKYRKYVFDETRYSINGGLSRKAINYYNNLGSDYFANADNKLRFLASSPATKITGKLQPEKLYYYFVVPKSPYSWKIAVKCYFTDGTNHSFYADDIAVSSAKLVVECCVGYSRLNLGNINPSKTVDKWEVWLEDSDSETISEVRTFLLDSNEREYERTFIFKNSFGCYEVARFIGEGEQAIQLKRASLSVKDYESYSHTNPPNKTYQAWETQKRKANTGWITQEQNDSFRDLLLTTECYEILDNLLFPVVISTTRIKKYEKDGVYLYSIDVEYERAYNDQYYTANFKNVEMITTEDLTQGVGVIFEASEEVTYFGYPQFGTTSETDATWRIKKIEKTYVSGKPKHIIKWADGDLNYDNQFSNCQSLSYAFLSS